MSASLLAYMAEQTQSFRHPPGKKAFQKLIYFMQIKGANLGFRYGFHLYGPYSKQLADQIEAQVHEGVLRYVIQNRSVLVCPGPAARFVIENFNEDIEENRHIVDEVLQTFDETTARELELLATTHYVAHIFRDDQKTLETALKIKEGKFTRDDFAGALDTLRARGYLQDCDS